MVEFLVLLGLLGLVCVLSGPIALFKISSLSRKVESLSRKLGEKGVPAKPASTVSTEKIIKPQAQPKEQIAPALPVTEEAAGDIKSKLLPLDEIYKAEVASAKKVAEPTVETKAGAKKGLMLEEQIGTKWILIAGVITVFVGVGFFLKYAYDNFSLSPTGRIIAVTICGIAALAAGEITRRRGYGIVAKGVTALGFAILYASIFTAHQFYGLIDFVPAFVLAISVTAAAMLYAVVLDEILIAFLSLLGGYLTPAIVLSKITSTTPLFVYISILSVGAMSCAYYRKWRSVNLLCSVGTFLLLAIWFSSSGLKYTIDAGKSLNPYQMCFVFGWLGVFFTIYFVMPILYELVHKVKTHTEDVVLILANASVVFFYLWTILNTLHRTSLALCAVALAIIHLSMMLLVLKRCKDDVNLRRVLLVIGLFFITISMPLYFKMHALTLAWAAESVILLVIGLRYRSGWTQTGGAVAFILSCGNLLDNLPMHTETFNLIINPEFGTWCFVAGAACISHLIYRRTCQRDEQIQKMIAQYFYGAMGLLLFAAATMEWYWHCRYNLMTEISIHYISRGQLIVFGAILLVFTIRPLCPGGIVSEFLSLVIVAVGSIFTIVALVFLHTESFTIFANIDFMIVIAFIASMLICHIKYRQSTTIYLEGSEVISQIIYALLGLLLLLAVAGEWYWHCHYNLLTTGAAPTLLKGQVLIFAVVMLLFVTRPISPPGIIPMIFAAIMAFVGAMFTMTAFSEFYKDSFVIFANTSFGIALLFTAAMFAAAWILVRPNDEQEIRRKFAIGFSLAGVFVLWVLLAEEIYLYWYCRNRFDQTLPNWRFLAHMYISVMWAVYGAALMVIGFWRRIRILRYLAIALFALLLAKVFILDTRTIENVYRIAAFLATGITLVGISYLYQFLKKKGFFEAILTDKT